MGRSCPVCHKVVQNLSSHLVRVHKISGPERTLLYQRSDTQNIPYKQTFATNRVIGNMESDNCTDFKLLHPFTCMVAGTTGCGKTVWVQKLLEHARTMISQPPQRIVYCYSQWQPSYVEMVINTFPEIEFVRGIPQDLEKDNFFDVNVRNLIVIDDQMTETGNDKRIVNLFTKGSHHRNLSGIYMVQNIFHQVKVNRDISLNCHYMVIFKNPRDKLQILNLAKQMYPGQTDFFLQKYDQAVSRPYGYFFLDLKTTTPDDCRFKTNIFPEEKTVDQEPKFQQELLQYLKGHQPPEMARMQEIQRKMNNILCDPSIGDSQKARQYIQLQNNFLRYKHKIDHINEVPRIQTEPLSNDVFIPSDNFVPSRETNTVPLESSNTISTPLLETENNRPETSSLLNTENLVTQFPLKYNENSSTLTPPPSTILTPAADSISRLKPRRLKLKNYMEGDPLSYKKPTIRRSLRVKNRNFPYKYEK